VRDRGPSGFGPDRLQTSKPSKPLCPSCVSDESSPPLIIRTLFLSLSSSLNSLPLYLLPLCLSHSLANYSALPLSSHPTRVSSFDIELIARLSLALFFTDLPLWPSHRALSRALACQLTLDLARLSLSPITALNF
jgi:hypothetical protein